MFQIEKIPKIETLFKYLTLDDNSINRKYYHILGESKKTLYLGANLVGTLNKINLEIAISSREDSNLNQQSFAAHRKIATTAPLTDALMV